MATVWIPHPVSEDISAASPWGDVRPITAGYVYGDQYQESGEDYSPPDDVARQISDTLRSEFDPLHDRLLIIGDHVQLLLAAAVLTEEFGGFLALRYDRKLRNYMSIRIETT